VSGVSTAAGLKSGQSNQKRNFEKAKHDQQTDQYLFHPSSDSHISAGFELGYKRGHWR
jgi:hypothetical protein